MLQIIFFSHFLANEKRVQKQGLGRKCGFSLLNFLVVSLRIILAIRGFLLLMSEVRASRDCKISSSDTALTTHAYLSMVGIV